MGQDSENKAERILEIYSKLKQGKVISKERESVRYSVASRTIQRDIADIQCFLQNQNVETGEVQEIVFDKSARGYVLQTKHRNQLEAKEVLAVAKVLLESRCLMKSELFPILYKLINTCNDEEYEKFVNEILRNEMHHYVELKHGKQLLEKMWILEEAVKNQNYISVQYRKLQAQETIKRKLKPVGVMFSEFYFYLTAYIEDPDRFRYSKEAHPTIYRLDRLDEIEVLEEKFSIPYADRFEEGEFRKRVQFMQGGKLKKIKLKCNEKGIEAVLDRFPTAKIIKKEKGDYIVQAEAFGDGVDLWVNGQKHMVEVYCDTDEKYGM